jgi:hypothetical protein
MDNKIQASRPDANQLKNLNRWLIGLVAFMLIWTVGILAYVDKKPEKEMPSIPVIGIDPHTGRITNVSHSRLLPKTFSVPFSPTNSSPMFVQKDSYEKMDFVIINYFFVSGIVVDTQVGGNYTIMYRDANRSLQRVVVPREFLLVPTSAYGVNPTSLLGP